MRALILETGRTRSALAAARGLHRDGWRVGVGSPLQGLAARSRCVECWHRLPAPEDSDGAYLDAVEDAARGYEIVFAAGDAELLLLAQAAERLDAVVPYPAHDTLLRGLDKLELTRAAERAQVAVPRTWQPADWDGSVPVVVKPSLKLPNREEGSGWRLGTRLADDEAEARRCIADIERADVEAVLQERLDGRLVAWSAVLGSEGAVLAEVQQEASLLWPTSGGVSARAVTVPVSPDVGRSARAVLAELGWTGLVQLQFMVCADGRPQLIDLNPRFYGSLALAIGAGANLPAIAAAAAMDRPPPAQPARVGARYHWFVGDLQAQLRSPRGRASGVAGALRWAVGAHHSVWSVRDPAPAAWYLASILRRLPRAT